MNGPLSPISVPAQKQLKYTAGIANGSVRESTAFIDQTRKVNILIFSITELRPFFFSANKVGSAVSADGTYRTFANKEISSYRTVWKAMEMEEEPSPVASTIQMEMAKALETLRMD